MPTGKARGALGLAQQALSQAAASATRALAQLGFGQPDQALARLDRLAGPTAALGPLPASLLAALAQSGWPDQALVRLERLVARGGGTTVLYRRVGEDPVLAERLACILGFSSFLADVLVRYPAFLYWLLAETPYLSQPLERATLRHMLTRETAGAEPVAALHRVQQRELLRLGAAQILRQKEVDQIGRELADLADAVVQRLLDLAWRELLPRWGRPLDGRGRPAKFCVVALGKYGGRELNYSSDIDLLFLYDEEGQTRAPRRGRPVDNAQFFRRLGERLIQLLTEVGPTGLFYRVDMRLRPEGRDGALVRSLASYWAYYEDRGELWERQMLLKARCASGSTQVWRRFRQMLVPFVFPVHFSVSPRREIRRIKDRIESQMATRAAGDNHIKLQAGGIRDIEFIVQCLQLLNGRINPQTRSHNTLTAIQRLRRAAVLSAGEARILEEAYRFLRQVENLLQIQEDRPVYAVPGEEGARRGLAGLMGLDTPLEEVLEGHLQRVRALYEAVFLHREEPGPGLDFLLDAEAGSARPARLLEKYGLEDGAAAHRRLLQLAQGGLASTASRRHLEGLLPELVAWLQVAPDPDQGLLRLVQVVQAYGAPGAFLELLEVHPPFRQLLFTLCGASRFLAELLCRDPALLDGLVGPEANSRALYHRARRDHRALRSYRDQEMLRIGADDLLGLTTSEETFWRLAELAEGVLQAVYRMAWRHWAQSRGRPRTRAGGTARFAIMAAGKFGGQEMDFGSDLDLFFVYEGEGHTGRGENNRQFFIEMAQEIVRLLQRQRLYEVDARLRPEGRSAPMALSLAAYRRYLGGRAATWERLALSRARFVAGDPGLGRRTEQVIANFVFGRPLNAADAVEMRAIRDRMEPTRERGKPAALDIKRGAGGLVDIEFIAQLNALRHGRQDKGLRLVRTRQILARLMERGLLEPDQGQFLLGAYDRLRVVEKGLRLNFEQASNTLPQGRELACLARSLGAAKPLDLVGELSALMAETRTYFEGLIDDLCKN